MADGKVVGLCIGRMEFGPRALGHRSIVGDARSPAMQSIMNLKIKYLESFRPFAPSVLAERVSDYFELDSESPYMLIVAPLRDELRREPDAATEDGKREENLRKWVNEVRSEIPAVTHIDYSARIQTVSQEQSPEYYATIKAFDDLTGCPVIINTSFNVRGEPIVNTPADAYRCFMRTEMDHLVLGSFVLNKADQPDWGRNPLLARRLRPRLIPEAQLGPETSAEGAASGRQCVRARNARVLRTAGGDGVDRVDTMRIAVGAADRLVGALEAGAWPDDRTPGGTFLAALVDLTAGPAGPSHPFERQGVVRALGECREHIESVTSDDPPDTTAVRERAAWAHSVFYQRMDGDADAVTDLQRLLDEHPQAVAVPASSAGVLEECLRWALYWKGSTARQEGQLRDAEQWYRLALDAGQLAARNELANVLDDLGQARAAKALWTTAARDGDANAASNLGAYYDRLGDMSESEAWFRRATDLGHLDASVRLGQRLYHRGERAEAERLWRRGAAEGLGDACEFLGILLLERDDVEGAHLWLEKAANEGHAGSCRQLAALYERLGRRKKTIEWLRTAALNGHPTAAEELHRLTSDDPFVAAEQHAAEELLRLSKSGPLVGRAANEFIAAATREQNRQADEAKQRRRRKGKG